MPQRARRLLHAKQRLSARERIRLLVDPDSRQLEIGLWAAYGMYEEWAELRAPVHTRASAGRSVNSGASSGSWS